MEDEGPDKVSNEVNITENGVSQTGFKKPPPGTLAKNTDYWVLPNLPDKNCEEQGEVHELNLNKLILLCTKISDPYFNGFAIHQSREQTLKLVCL